MIELILISVILVGLLIGTLSDIKTREVPDWVSYSLICLGLGLRLIYSLYYSEFAYIIEGIIGLAVFFIIGMTMFYTAQWGGGDTKLLMGVGSLIGFSIDFTEFPQLVSFFINLLVVGAVYGLLWSIVLAVKHRSRFIVSFRKNHGNKKIRFARRLILAGSVLMLALIFLPVDLLIKMLFLLLAAIPIFTFYIWIFAKSVEQSCMFKRIPPDRLTEGDWVQDEIKIARKVIYSKKELGISKKQIELIKRYYKNKKILVKEGIPFVPSFLLAYIITLLFNAWFLMFL
jgi:prepilin peptidase CpaA